MLRRKLIERSASIAPDPALPERFRWRGHDVSRIESFSDAVFGFALTLLVVSLEVPRTFDQLQSMTRQFPSFAVCFALFTVIWHLHYKYFRLYGLSDAWTIVLNTCLLFLILFYVYPLKFLWSTMFDAVLQQRMPRVEIGGALVPVVSNDQWPTLFTYFSGGYAAVFFVFALMYINALRQADRLELTRLERSETREQIVDQLLHVGIGIASVVIAHKVSLKNMGRAGMVYWLVPVVLMTNGVIHRKLLAKANRTLLTENETVKSR